jgi:glycerol uptake facilitator-like aquaporin
MVAALIVIGVLAVIAGCIVMRGVTGPNHNPHCDCGECARWHAGQYAKRSKRKGGAR